MDSTAFVTDANATVTQGFLYAPFGEITTEYAPMWQNGVLPKYAFNAKELDEETGMYYYEARYMAPPTFISRDPHFERYFWHSPYAYCGNNPLNKVDPTGMDEWEVDLVNKTVSVVAGTEGTPDKFTVLDKDGNRITSNSYERGTIQKIDSRSAASFAISGDAAGTDLFEFLADNTGVEWAQLATGKEGSGTNFLFSSFDENKVIVDVKPLKDKYIRKHVHNHTNSKCTFPTDPEDFDAVRNCQRHNLGYYFFSMRNIPPMKFGCKDSYCMPDSYIYVNKKYIPYGNVQSSHGNLLPKNISISHR